MKCGASLKGQAKGKTLLQIINEQEPERDFSRKEVCAVVCAEVTPGCSCGFLDLFTKRRFLEVLA
jgi:hypothetical protein